MAALIAVAVKGSGEREVVGVDVGSAENFEFWLGFCRQLAIRGLSGVKLVISDAHLGLKHAIQQVFIGAAWQRCRVHFMRNVLATVPKAAHRMVAATIRTGGRPPGHLTVGDQMMGPRRYPHFRDQATTKGPEKTVVVGGRAGCSRRLRP